MVRSLDDFLEPTEHSTTDHTGLPGVLLGFGGDGSLGNVNIVASADVEGVKNYRNLTISGTFDLSATAGRNLTIRCSKDLNLATTSSIHADGRGGVATAGEGGGPAPNNASTPTDALLGHFGASGGSGGGGGGSSSGPSDTNGGDGAAGLDRNALDSAGAGTAGTGGALGGPASPGTSGTAATAISVAFREPFEDAGLPISYGLLFAGAGGAGGGDGGGGGTGNSAAGGAAGGQASPAIGDGANGTNGGPGVGGGGGGGGAGGGILLVEVAGDTVLHATARISANGGAGGDGGDGGAGGDAGTGGGGGGGGGAGGAGGICIFRHLGAITNVDGAHVTANGGAGGSGGAGTAGVPSGFNGGAGGNGAAGESGYTLIDAIGS